MTNKDRSPIGRVKGEQTYCDRLVQDTPFLTSLGRLSEQQVDRIILQLNRYYPQILSNKDAEKFRNPKVSLRVRLCDLLGHLQRSGERDCQEFYRALYIHAQPLHSCLPSRHALRKCVSPLALASPCSALRQRQPSGCVLCVPQRVERVFQTTQISVSKAPCPCLPMSLCVSVYFSLPPFFLRYLFLTRKYLVRVVLPFPL
uniref:Caspase recruitment domain family member 19 n=1 Tax=Ovis aries TaxID=9940 RepID=A0AC11ENH8_SHEEP